MQIKGTLMLLGAAFFWGTTFVAQLVGMDGLGPFSYAAARYLTGFLSLLVILIFTRKSRAVERRQKNYQRGFLIGLDNWRGAVYRNLNATNRPAIFDGRQGGVYHMSLYRVRSTRRKIFRKNNSAGKLVGRRTCNRRLISFGSRRKFFNSARRRNTFYQRICLDGANFIG